MTGRFRTSASWHRVSGFRCDERAFERFSYSQATLARGLRAAARVFLKYFAARASAA